MGKKKKILGIILIVFFFMISQINFSKGEIINQGVFTYDHCAKIFDNNTVIAYWKLNETSGINAYDSTGNNRNGTLINMDNSNWVSGKLNNALYFDGVNEYVDCDNLEIADDSDFSIEAWINLTKVNGFKTIMGKYDSSALKGWVFYADRRRLSFIRQEAQTSFFMIQSQGTLLPINDYAHVVYTHSGFTGETNALYIDGVKVDDYGLGFGTPLNFQSPLVNLTIGYSELAGYFRGEIDNVLLYNVELTPSEVRSQYNKSFGIEAYPDGDPPCFLNLEEITDPLELGGNITITLDSYDQNNITNIYLEYNGVNHTMNNISEFYYSGGNWNPLYSGVIPYKIWFLDNRGNIGVYLGSINVLNSAFIVISTITLLSFMGLMLIFYLKKRIWLIMLSIFLFSLIVGVFSLSVFMFPFTPYFQIFFLVFQTVLFYLSTRGVFNGKKE